jgi:hypothetical protein
MTLTPPRKKQKITNKNIKRENYDKTSTKIIEDKLKNTRVIKDSLAESISFNVDRKIKHKNEFYVNTNLT